MWHFADCEPGADIFVGLHCGVSRSEFERRTADGTVAECFHRIAVRPGDTMFLPSGRVHALGAGSVLFEIQQNSDTTYRVFDWNRVGLDGKPRELLVAQALESIDFTDFEPGLVPARDGALVEHELFDVSLRPLASGAAVNLAAGLQVLGVVRGAVEVSGGGERVAVKAGGFCVVPASVGHAEVRARGESSLLVAHPH
jgi:mannose-6-phosphate isomerase